MASTYESVKLLFST